MICDLDHHIHENSLEMTTLYVEIGCVFTVYAHQLQLPLFGFSHVPRAQHGPNAVTGSPARKDSTHALILRMNLSLGETRRTRRTLAKTRIIG